MSSSGKKTTDMTLGSISHLLIRFAVPLLAGNLFQQFYNTIDSVVVGNYVGKEALAAVGSSGQFIRVLVGFFMGLATGGGVVVSRYFGAHDIQRLRKTIHTMILGAFLLGITFTAIGVISSPFMLRVISTPLDVFFEATKYLRIYFMGITFLMIYNMGAGIMRAVGDSSHPFYFLVVSSVINVVLDIWFVVFCKMGVAGVAYATVIAEAVSMTLVLVFLFCSKDIYKLKINEMRISIEELKKILKTGLPGGIQVAITSFSNVFAQSYINHFGSACMAGWSSYLKIDQFAMLPMNSLSLSITTFVGQNYGAQKIDRVKQGIGVSMKISMAITFVMSVILFVFAQELTMLFGKDYSVVYYGVFFLHVCSPFYVPCCIYQIHAGSLRGLGKTTVPVVIMLSSFVAFRQVFLFIVTRFSDSIFPIACAFPAAWVLCWIIMQAYFFKYTKNIFSNS